MKVMQILDGSHSSDITSLDFSHDLLATASNDRTIRLWKQTSVGMFEEESQSPLHGHTYGVNCIKFSLQGMTLASCSTDGTIILWNVQSGLPIETFTHPTGLALRVIAFSPKFATLISGGDDEQLVLWDLATKNIARVFIDHDAMVTSATFSPDGIILVSGSTAGELKLWDACYGHNKCLLTQNEAHDLGVTACDFSSIHDGSIYTLATCGNDDLVKLWTVIAGRHYSLTLSKLLYGHSANVMSCKFSPNGQLLVSGSGDKKVILWNIDKGEILHELTKHTRYVICCAYSLCGKFLATGSNDKTVIIWNSDSFSPSDINSPESSITNKFKVENWTASDVSSWLTKLGFETYIDIFLKNNINGQELLNLTEESLSSHLKIESLGHCNQIAKSIQGLRNPLWKEMEIKFNEGLENLPNEFYCPITHEIMREPVVAADGYSYERNAIKEWIETGKNTSPLTNKILQHTELIPNHNLRLLINKYVQ